jgi:hypothetical protein
MALLAAEKITLANWTTMATKLVKATLFSWPITCTRICQMHLIFRKASSALGAWGFQVGNVSQRVGKENSSASSTSLCWVLHSFYGECNENPRTILCITLLR